jgi:hypothetical protein
MTNRALTDIFRGLRDLGLTKGQVASLLPAWWTPEIAATEAGLWETAVLLGRRLSIDSPALVAGEVRPIAGIEATRYKHTVRVTPLQLRAATLMATSLARAVVESMLPSTGGALPQAASSIRDSILAMTGAIISFDTLVDYCWSHGIPVIPLPNVPHGVKKMDASAIRVDGRPAIVISIRNNSKAWLSFLVAHELGHLCLGHVSPNASIVEGSISDSADFDVGGETDQQELQANAFAHELMGGHEIDQIIERWARDLPAVSLATSAMADARPLRTAPGHLILRHAFLTRQWPEARSALNFLSDDLDAQSTLVERLSREIDTAQLADDLQDYVERLTGVTPRP